MCVYRMQKCASGHTISAGAGSSHWIERRGKSGTVVGATIATDDIISAVAQVGIKNTELSVVEDIECFCAELKGTAFRHFEVFQQAYIKIRSVWVVQEITPCITEGKSTWCLK